VIDGADLRFSMEGSRQVARLLAGDDLDPAIRDRMIARADGWAAGLVLLISAGAGRPVPADPGSDAAPDALFDYFATEVYGSLPDDRRAFLERLALLPVITTAGAQSLARERRAGEFLADLAGRGYFTTRHRGASDRYELHPLFRDFLRRRLDAGTHVRRTPVAPHRSGLARRSRSAGASLWADSRRHRAARRVLRLRSLTRAGFPAQRGLHAADALYPIRVARALLDGIPHPGRAVPSDPRTLFADAGPGGGMQEALVARAGTTPLTGEATSHAGSSYVAEQHRTLHLRGICTVRPDGVKVTASVSHRSFSIRRGFLPRWR
jgi:hypothetical protein